MVSKYLEIYEAGSPCSMKAHACKRVFKINVLETLAIPCWDSAEQLNVFNKVRLVAFVNVWMFQHNKVENLVAVMYLLFFF